MYLEHQNGAQCHVLMNETEETNDDDQETSERQTKTKQRKLKHKELQEKQLSLEKRQELDRANTKEGDKIINSGPMKVHVGLEAKRIEDEVGKDRTLQSRFVYTSDDGTPEGRGT